MTENFDELPPLTASGIHGGNGGVTGNPNVRLDRLTRRPDVDNAPAGIHPTDRSE